MDLAQGPGPSFSGLFLAAAITLLAAACGSREQPLTSTGASPRELARAVLSGIASRDADLLHRLALSEQEFREHVWPQLPSARPERNLPFSYIWGDLRQKSELGLQNTLARYGGRLFELVDVRFGHETDYATYRVHRDTALVVRDVSGGESTIRVCGSMLEKDGAWKVFSYVVDE